MNCLRQAPPPISCLSRRSSNSGMWNLMRVLYKPTFNSFPIAKVPGKRSWALFLKLAQLCFPVCPDAVHPSSCDEPNSFSHILRKDVESRFYRGRQFARLRFPPTGLFSVPGILGRRIPLIDRKLIRRLMFRSLLSFRRAVQGVSALARRHRTGRAQNLNRPLASFMKPRVGPKQCS